ncbi:hypothetical protein [Levilactobacillus enshiensis]|uniref:hypothetical protein n=1 Tax=Levilactobacillus enshiensis TaxID=2590213 RepID=UPI001179C115|nr:hypothetical protein [Levilactobacillus enshiensis]
MMTQNLLTGTFILVSGIALLIFLFVKLIPKTKRDTDTTALLTVYVAVAVFLVGMGGWVSLMGLGHFGSAMGCWL